MLFRSRRKKRSSRGRVKNLARRVKLSELFQTLISNGHSHSDILHVYSINKSHKFYERIIEKEISAYRIHTLISGVSARLAFAGDKKTVKACNKEWKKLLEGFVIKKKSSAGELFKKLFNTVPNLGEKNVGSKRK